MPSLYHGSNPSRLEHQGGGGGGGGMNNAGQDVGGNNNTNNGRNVDMSESRLNKSRLYDYGGMNTYQNEHLHAGGKVGGAGGVNKYGGSDYSHLPHIRQND